MKTSLNLVVKNSNWNQVAIAEAIKKQLSDIGIAIQIIKASDEQYYQYLQNKNYQMILIGINAPITINIESFIGKENFSNYINDEIVNLTAEVKNTQDLNRKKEIFNRMAEIYLDDSPWVALYYNKNTIAFSNKLRAELSPNWYNIYYNINEWYREV